MFNSVGTINNLDQIKENCIVSVDGTVVKSCPLPTWFTVYSSIIDGSASYMTQLAITYAQGGAAYIRGKDGGAWKEWAKL